MFSVNEENKWTLPIKMEDIPNDVTLTCNTEIITHPLYSIFCSRIAWHFSHLTQFQPWSIPNFYVTNLIILNRAKQAIQTRWEHDSSKNLRWHVQICVCVCACVCVYIYRVSQEEGTKLRECVPYVKIYRYNPKHLYPKLNGYGDNGQRSLKLWQLLHTYWLTNTY